MKQKGFSLIELMIAVGVIGVLVAIAVPNYQKMVARSRQGEAKIELAKMFSAMSVFRQERGSYSLCLWQAGFRPNNSTKRYYGMGYLNDPGTLVCAGQSCWVYDFRSGAQCGGTGATYDGSTRNDATFNENFSANPSHSGVPASNVFSPTTDTFRVGAWGSISRSTVNLDIWSIDHQKNVVQVQDGTN